MVIFAFQSHKFSRRFSTSACEALLSDLNSKCDSRINFPGRSEALARRCRLITSGQTHYFFSHKISCGQLKRPEWRRHFSHITFRTALENAVCARSRNAKQSQSQPRKVICESLPLLRLNHHDAASFYFENREKYPEKRQLDSVSKIQFRLTEYPGPMLSGKEWGSVKGIR